ncbi:hypothetical protein AUJ62_03830 [Candidatus Pacearchaeota archaeon CG1_02_32_21]|nr:MAG: hypothetical protein AUJ62_03830 [Candidatus Pacearchaeota archaeon CG1_02_32_21]
MKCNCSIGNILLGIIILVFALWQTAYSKWIVVIASVLLIIHELWHKHSWVKNKNPSPVENKKKRK